MIVSLTKSAAFHNRCTTESSPGDHLGPNTEEWSTSCYEPVAALTGCGVTSPHCTGTSVPTGGLLV